MEYFTTEDLKQAIIEELEFYNGYYCDLHNEVFNMGYYIVGTSIAKEALNEYGVFEAIEEVQNYEQEQFGEVYTDLSNPEKVANMLWYVLGANFMYNNDFSELLSENIDNLASEEVNNQLIELIKEC